MEDRGLWEELKRRRVVRVVVAYGAVAIGVLEVAQLTFGALGIPEWAFRLLVFVALAGFPLAVALAWALERTPDGVRAEPADAKTGFGRRGWSVVGAALAVSLVIAVVLNPFGAPSEPPVVAQADAIAVVPFRVTSDDTELRVLGEGIVDWLTPHLDRSVPVIDEGRVLSAWQAISGDIARAPTEQEALDVGRRVGADKVLIGAVVGSPGSYTVNARLLAVASGDEVGRASVEGTATEINLTETVRALATQVLTLEAGIVGEQVDHLLDVPIEALDFYLRGRSAYQGAFHLDARTWYARALEVDSTFALAALRLREMSGMTLDAPRLALSARSDRVIAANPDKLPPDDLLYYRLWINPGVPRSAATRVEDARSLVTALPYKPEAWYLLGDNLLHDAFRHRADDARAESVAAFERALELDGGFTNVRLHLLFDAGFYDDTLAARERAAPFANSVDGSESATYARTMLAYLNDDPDFRASVRASVDTLSLPHLRYMTYLHGLSGSSITNDEMDEVFDRLSGVSALAGDREDAEATRLRYLFSAGRTVEASRLLEARIASGEDDPATALLAQLHWDGSEDFARRFVADVEAEVSGAGALPWDEGGESACILATWRLRMGEPVDIPATISRLQAGVPEPRRGHDRNLLCVALLEALDAERAGATDLTARLVRLVDDADQGLGVGRPLVLRELARMLEAQGQGEAAARMASYIGSSVPFPPLRSTVHREAGRLYDAIGDLERARFHYRRYTRMRPEPDEAHRAGVAAVRARLAEIEALLASSRP